MNPFRAIGKCISLVAERMGLSIGRQIFHEELNSYEKAMNATMKGLKEGDIEKIKEVAIFFTESSVAFSQSLVSELNYVQKQLTTKEVNRIKTVVDICHRKYLDESEKRREYFSALNSASEAIRNLMDEVNDSCAEICRVAAMSDNDKRLHFRGELVQSVKEKSSRARKCLDAILIGMSCVQFIGAETELQNIKSINSDYLHFIDKMLEGSTCLTMHQYDVCGGEDEFWLQVPQNARNLELLSQYFHNSGQDEDIDMDFDNISFGEEGD